MARRSLLKASGVGLFYKKRPSVPSPSSPVTANSQQKLHGLAF